MRLYVDLTCSWEEAGRIAHGTLRVERGLAQAFAAMGRDDISFVRYERARDRFVVLSRQAVIDLLGAPVRAERRRGGRPAWRQGTLFALGRDLEKWVRERVRAPLRRWLNRFKSNETPGAAGSADVAFAPGDTLFLPSELRHNQRTLIFLRERGVRLAMLFYDLLATLPDDDEQLRDPRKATLPSSDFMAHFADLTFAISYHSAGIFARHLERRHLPPRGVEVIRLASDLDPGMDLQAAEGVLPRDFILCVGDVHPRKNQQLLVDVWREALQHGVAFPRLLIVGRVDGGGANFVRDVRADPALASRIVFKSNVTDAELAWLYANCRFAVFPSLDEGFGLPVAEVLSFGRVCVASNAGAIPEAGQGFAVLCDPRDRTSWRETIELLSIDDDVLASHEHDIRNGFQRSTWHDAATTILHATSCT